MKMKRATCNKAGALGLSFKASKLADPSSGLSKGKHVGAHVSASGGLHKAISNAELIGCESFAVFLRNNHRWDFNSLKPESIDLFKTTLSQSKYTADYILPHASYLINLGSPKEEVAYKSYSLFVDDLKRCELLGLRLYNFHPGSSCGTISAEDCMERIAAAINKAHSETSYCITVLENMCCQGNTVGGKFSELKSIIDMVEDKERVGVCLDTCHVFAAGHDISNKEGYEEMMQSFDNVIGLKNLKGVHLNDSKGACGSHLDRHELIGKGKIGKTGFELVMNDSRLNGIPMILETPGGTQYEKEIKLLYSLVEK